MRINRLLPLCLSLLAGMLALTPQVDPDAWWHLRIAAEALQHGLPHSETLSWLNAGSPWSELSSLSSSLLLIADQLAGPFGQSILFWPVWSLTALLLWAIIRHGDPERSPFAVSVITLLTVLLLGVVIAPRAASFDPLLALATIWILMRAAERPRHLAALIPLAVVWANLHGPSLVLFAVIAGIWTVGGAIERRRPVWSEVIAVALALLAALLFNPYGIEPLLYPLAHPLFGGSPIIEWQPLDPGSPSGLAIRLLLSGAIALSGLGGGDPTPRRRLMIAAFAFYGLGSARALLVALPVLAVSAAPLLVGVLSAIRRHRAADAGLAHLASFALLLALLPAGLVRFGAILPDAQAQLLAARYPSARLLRLADVCPQVANPYDWGGWIARARPTAQVGAYGGLYGEPFAPLNPLVARQADLESGLLETVTVLREQGADAAIVPIGSLMERDLLAAGWPKAGEDQVARLFLDPDGGCFSIKR